MVAAAPAPITAPTVKTAAWTIAELGIRCAQASTNVAQRACSKNLGAGGNRNNNPVVVADNELTVNQLSRTS